MNREDIIRMAREAGFSNPERFDTTDRNLQGILSDFWENIERFAALVAAAEREACAQVGMMKAINGIEVAAAIRARGQA